MIRISKGERYALEEAGLLQYKKNGQNPKDQNFTVANKQHGSGAKSYYIVESPEVLGFLGLYDSMDLIRIKKSQVDSLLEAKMVRQDQIQEVGTYSKSPIIFVDRKGQYRMRKISKLIGFLKANQNKD